MQQHECTLVDLTEKQVEVLDLLLEYKTSKEIARELGISPHTVDQRIKFAREKLNANSRSELAKQYKKARKVYEQPVYQKTDIERSAFNFINGDADEADLSHLRQEEFIANDDEWPGIEESQIRMGPEFFGGELGKLTKFSAIIGLALLTMLVFLTGLAAFSQLSVLLSN